MKKTKIFAVISTAIFLSSLLVPTVVLGQSQQEGTQSITGGSIIFYDSTFPQDFSFDTVSVSNIAGNHVTGSDNYTTDPTNPVHALAIEDTSDGTAWSYDITVSAVTRSGGTDTITRDYLYVVTYPGGFDPSTCGGGAASCVDDDGHVAYDPNAINTASLTKIVEDTDCSVDATNKMDSYTDMDAPACAFTDADSNVAIMSKAADVAAPLSGVVRTSIGYAFSGFGQNGAAPYEIAPGAYTATFTHTIAIS